MKKFITCIDGVLYMFFTEMDFPQKMAGYMSVKYNRDGTVVTCSDDQSK